MATQKQTQQVEHTPAEGRAVLALGNHYWARGDSIAAALKGIRSEGLRRGSLVILYDVPTGTQVSGMGHFTYWPPEGRDWDVIRAEEGKSPTEWAAIREIGRTKLGSKKISPPEPVE